MADAKSGGGGGSGGWIAFGILMGFIIVALVAYESGKDSRQRDAVLRPAPALGTPGGGYVPGAPTSAAECVKRGGTDTGRGCSGYR